MVASGVLVPVTFLAATLLGASILGGVLMLVEGAVGGVAAAAVSVPGLLLTVAVAIGLHVFSLRVYAQQVESIMRRRVGEGRSAVAGSADAATSSESSLQSGTTAALGATSDEGAIEFRRYDATAESLIDTPGERFIRDRLLNRRGRIFLSFLMLGLVASFAVGTREWLAYVRGTGELPSSTSYLDAGRLALPYAVAAVVLVTLFVQRLTVGLRSAIVVGIIANAWPHVMDLPSRFGRLYAPPVPPGLAQRTMGSYMAVMAVGFVLSMVLTRATGANALVGKRLLVLRVFGADRNTASLFSLIVRRWTFLGPVVTVVDPSYAKVTFGRSRYTLLFAVALPVILLATLFSMFPPLAVAGLAVFYIIGLPPVFAYALWRLRVSTGRTLAAVEQRLDFETASLMRVRHPAIQLTCFADVWQATVGKLVEWSDAILVDLRGFTRERQGVAYELRYLMNHCALSRIAFLTDRTTDAALFRQTLSSQWGALDPRSPNAGVERPVVHVYAASGTGWELRPEMRPILALLGELTTTAAPHRAPAVDGRRDSERARNRKVSAAIIAAWVLLAVGAVLGETQNWDNNRLGSGLSIMWLAVLALMLTTRMRRLLLRDGSLQGLWRRDLWSLAFALLASGWIFQYVLLQPWIHSGVKHGAVM